MSLERAFGRRDFQAVRLAAVGEKEGAEGLQ